MDTDTKLRPDRTKLRTPRPMARPAGRRTPTVLLVLALAGVLGAALVVAVLVGRGPRGSEFPPPSVSPVQAERWGTVDQLTPAEQHELQRFRNAVDVDRLTLAEQHEVQRFRNAVDATRTARPTAAGVEVATTAAAQAARLAAARHELRAMQAAVRAEPALRTVMHDEVELRVAVGAGHVPTAALDEGP